MLTANTYYTLQFPVINETQAKIISSGIRDYLNQLLTDLSLSHDPIVMDVDTFYTKENTIVDTIPAETQETTGFEPIAHFKELTKPQIKPSDTILPMDKGKKLTIHAFEEWLRDEGQTYLQRNVRRNLTMLHNSMGNNFKKLSLVDFKKIDEAGRLKGLANFSVQGMKDIHSAIDAYIKQQSFEGASHGTDIAA